MGDKKGVYGYESFYTGGGDGAKGLYDSYASGNAYNWDVGGGAGGGAGGGDKAGGGGGRQPPGYDYGAPPARKPGAGAAGYDELMSREQGGGNHRGYGGYGGGGYQDFTEYDYPTPMPGRKRPYQQQGGDDYYGMGPPPARGYGGDYGGRRGPPYGGDRYGGGGGDNYDYGPPQRGGRGRGGGPPGARNNRGGYPVEQRSRLQKPATPKSFHQVLKVPTTKQLWVEAKKPNGSIYYYSPTSPKVVDTIPEAERSVSVVVTETQLYAKLDEFQPATMLIRGKLEQMDEGLMEGYFQGFGDVHFIKLAWKSELYPTHAFLRMNTMMGQRKLLAHRGPHYIVGQQIRIFPPYQRMLVSRIPESVSKMDLLRFFSEEARQIDPGSYVIDAYRPMPFTQFAFIVFGDKGQAAERFGGNHQITMNGAVLQCLHAPHCGLESPGAGKISVGDSTPKLTGDQIASEFDKMVQKLRNGGNAAKAVALEALKEDTQAVMLQLVNSTNEDIGIGKPAEFILRKLSEQLLAQTDDKLRKYVLVQEHLFHLCDLAFPASNDDANFQES